MTLFFLLLFWLSVALLVYTYLGFPLLLLLRAVLFPRPYQTGEIHPRLAVLIAAYNEESCIEEKLNSLLASDYPLELLQIFVASDGSTDGTEAIVARHPAEQVELLRLPHGGKAATLNTAAQQIDADVIVFTDANSIFAADALSKLVAPFADSDVGGVAGDQRYLKLAASSASGQGERSYWNLDRVCKQLESRAGNVISATGAIYAIRRELFKGVCEGVTDDFAISTSVIEQGRRLVFEEQAAAFEPVAASSRLEFGRKVRVIMRGFRAVWMRRKLLNPFRYGFYSLQLFSHKVLRRLMVIPLLSLLISSLILWQTGWVYRIAAIAQLGFYFAAVLPLVAGRRGKSPVALPFFFCMVNAAAAVALVRTLLGARITRWETHRSDSVSSAAP